MSGFSPQYLVVHCTGEDRFRHDSRTVDRWHRANGWSGCGYHDFVTEDAEWQTAPKYPLRAPDQIGAHVRGLNSRSWGLCIEGLYDQSPPSVQVWDRAVWVAAYRARALGVGSEQVIGHREAQRLLAQRVTKTCPGLAFDMALFRDAVAEELKYEPRFVTEFRKLYRWAAGNEDAIRSLNFVRQYLPDRYNGGA